MRIVVVGGGPAGYEAALVAAELGSEVTIVDRSGLGGACVLYDCVPSKTLCTCAEAVTWMEAAEDLGVVEEGCGPARNVNLRKIVRRINWLAEAQSRDIEKKLRIAGVRRFHGSGRLVDPHRVEVDPVDGERLTLDADVILLATGASPRQLPTARPDGVRILDARQVYDLKEIPEHLIVVGSGSTGAEFAHAFSRLGSAVTLVASRDRLLPGEDADAAKVLEDVFARRGIEVVKPVRATAAHATDSGVVVELGGGRTIEGSHALFTIGMVANSAGLGLGEAGVRMLDSGWVPVDAVSRTNVPHIYAAGDLTGNSRMLASVAAAQGRIAMWHALGQAVRPIQWDGVASAVFTDPEIATAGLSQRQAEEMGLRTEVIVLPLSTNARAKMVGLQDGFVKLISLPGTGIVVGGTIVGPHASDLIMPVSVAVHARLGVDQLAGAFSIYPSLGGSIQEAARLLVAVEPPGLLT